jgi:SAM-dependent methyltransferase
MLLIGKYYWFTIQEEWRVRSHLYRYPLFQQCDRALKKAYRFKNPYRLCKKHCTQKAMREVHVYGETPLSTWRRIATESRIKSCDYVIDLGCGRGRGVFFLSTVIGCSAHGIDWNPAFIGLATKVQQEHKIPRTTFSCEDMCLANLDRASVIYLYGTCLDECSLQRLVHLFWRLSPGVRIVSVSYPLESFRLIKRFPGTFPWGETDLYLHEV